MKIRYLTMAFKNLTVSVDESIIKELKQLALDKDTSQKQLINDILREGIHREKNQLKLDVNG